MTDFSPALVTFEAHQKFFTDVYLEGHTFLVKYMWPSFLMSLASTVDIQDYCFSRASRLSNRWFTFFSCCIFTMLESSQTHLQMWDGRRQDTASVLLLSLLYTSFFFCSFFMLLLSHCYQRGVTLLTGRKQVYLFCAMKFLCIFVARWHLILTST